MKNLTQVLFALFCLCMPALLHAQRDDSKYLAGAVPEADGKVVFTKDFSIPGMSQDTIYSRLLKWMDTRLAKNENTSAWSIPTGKKDRLWAWATNGSCSAPQPCHWTEPKYSTSSPSPASRRNVPSK